MIRTVLALLVLALGALCCGSAKKSCTAISCVGCCDVDGSCLPGTTTLACGQSAALCATCTIGQSCSLGHCGFGVGGGSGTGGGSGVGGGAATGGGSATGGGAANCQASCAGCCTNGVCSSGTAVSACGAGGAVCAACSGSQTCAAGVCRDSACNGCVQSGACVTNVSNTQCGALGLSCFDCTVNGGSCDTTTGTCTGGACAGCKDSLGRCQPGDTKGACGNLGASCVACGGAEVCLNGACTSGAGGGAGTGGGGAATGGGTGTGGGGVACADNDQDGVLSCNGDCNDNDPNVGPNAFEVAGNGVDDNCNGQTDEAPTPCDTAVFGNTGLDLAKAIGACDLTVNSTVTGNALGRAAVARFGDNFSVREGSKMVLLSTGKAVDQYLDAGYEPQDGTDFMMTASYPFYIAPKCGMPANPGQANDLEQLDLTVKVPQNAHAFTLDFAFFTAEYPEWTCTQFNDRFLLLSTSQANSAIAFPNGMCINGQCNVAYDPVNNDTFSASSAVLDICDAPPSSLNLTNHCTRAVSLLTHTGYSDLRPSQGSGGTSLGNLSAGGSTGWRRVTGPAKPGEVLELKLIVLDEADGILDTAVLLDHLWWSTAPVSAGTTTDLMTP